MSKKQQIFGLHYGDLGVIIIALVALFGFLALMFAPDPLKGLDKFDHVADKIRGDIVTKNDEENRQKAIDDAVASGVVTVGIVPAKKP